MNVSVALVRVAPACLAIGLLLPARAVLAEPPPAPARSVRTTSLSLDEALRLADASYETPRIARAQLERARAVRREAFATLLPSITLNGTYTRRAFERFQTFTNEETGESERLYFQRHDALGSQAVLEARIFDPGAYPLYDASGAAVRAAELELVQIRRALAFDVAEAYVSVLAAEQLVAAANQRLAYAEETVRDAERRRTTGLGSTGEVTRGDLERTAAAYALVQARRTVELARLSLSLLVGEDVRGPLEEPPAQPPTVTDDPERQALAERPDVLAQEERVREQALFAEVPWRRLFPTLSLRAFGSATNEPGLTGALNGNIALTLSWTVFDGGVRYAQAAARRAELEAAQLTTDLLKRRVGYELATARLEIETAEASIAASEARVKSARANLTDVQVRRTSGLASALEQADAAVAAFEADAELVRQRLALRRAQLLLLEALGRWPTTANGTRTEAP